MVLYDKPLAKYDETLYDKLKALADDLKSGKRNQLKSKSQNAKIDSINNITPAEREYVYHEIDTHISNEEKRVGRMTRRLFNKELNKDFLYHIKYDKNGNHKIRRTEINE